MAMSATPCVTELLDRAAGRFGFKPAVITPERTLSFSELHRLSSRFSAGLAALGLAPGECVTLCIRNGWRWPVAYYGVLRAGAVAVPLNAHATLPEARFAAANCNSVLTVLCNATLPAGSPPKESQPAALPNSVSFDEVLDRGERALRAWCDPVVSSNDLCAICYTSGTTGVVKGVALRHESVAINASMTALMHGLHPGDTVVTPLPLAHVYGTTVLNASVAVGAPIVVLPRLEERNVLDAIERHRATVLYGVPSMYLTLLNLADLERFDLRSLRMSAVGGQGMAIAKMQELETRLRCRLVELWGMTEIAGLGTTHPHNGPSRLGSIGVPLPFTQARVAVSDGSDGCVDQGEIGELQVRGPHVMYGYWNAPQETAAALASDGWLRTGDLVREDEKGYLYLVDRLKDVILSGGYTLYPAEIERVIAEHPSVSACLVTAVPDELRGHTLKASVVRRAGAKCEPEDLLRFCRHNLASYKVPRTVEFVASLPTGVTGKAMRRAGAARQSEASFNA